MGAKGKRKCPICGKWTEWTKVGGDGICSRCRAGKAKRR